MAQVGQDLVSPSIALTPPFVVPFDATSTATTTLYHLQSCGDRLGDAGTHHL
jgi:hypothetical protein